MCQAQHTASALTAQVSQEEPERASVEFWRVLLAAQAQAAARHRGEPGLAGRTSEMGKAPWRGLTCTQWCFLSSPGPMSPFGIFLFLQGQLKSYLLAHCAYPPKKDVVPLVSCELEHLLFIKALHAHMPKEANR